MKNYFVSFSSILLVLLIGGEIMAQGFYDHLPKSGVYDASKRKKDKRVVLTWNPAAPLQGSSLKISPDGAISGKVMITGVDAGGNKATLSAEQQDSILSSFKTGIAYWSKATTVVCGRSVKLTPDLEFTFIDSTANYRPENAIIYVLAGQGRVNEPTDAAPMFGAMYFPYATQDGWWAQSIEPLRGTGKLPAFALLMADPLEVAKTYPQDWAKYLQSTAAHEFGHALGLWDTYVQFPTTGDVVTLETPKGLMNSIDVTEHTVYTAYVAEIMTRVLECRIDVKIDLEKSEPIDKSDWDYKAKLTYKWSNALTSEWAYYNGFANNYNENTCTSDASAKKYMTYKHCDGAQVYSDVSTIKFNLSGKTQLPAYYDWEENGAAPQPPTEAYSLLSGNCAEPIKNKASSKYLSGLSLVLANDGAKAWLINRAGFYASLDLKAEDPKPDYPPDCLIYHTLEGGETTAPLTGGALVEGEGNLIINKQMVGKFHIGVDMRLSPKQ
jgi:hypothetical protein